MKPISTHALWLACALALAASNLQAQTAANPTPDEARQQLDAARAELDRAAKRFAELSMATGDAYAEPIIIEQRNMRSPVLGVVLAPDPSKGVRIAAVTPDSAAAKAGLRSGDRIVSVDGKAISASSADARLAASRELLSDLSTGTAVAIGYERDGKGAAVKVSPQLSERVMVFRGTDGSSFIPRGNVHWRQNEDGQLQVEADSVTHEFPDEIQESHEVIMIEGGRPMMGRRGMASPMIAPHMRTEIIRVGRDGCEDGGCSSPMLMEAFRWNGLNLASVDPGLGRYFGTDKGVLVLSTGPELKGLQGGDVIRKVDGKAVGTPREAMDALRGKATGSQVPVEYLRDRKSASIQLTVPEPMMINVPRPPVPPAPPAAPGEPATPAVSPSPPPPPPPPVPGATPPSPPEAPSPPTPAGRSLAFV